MEGAQIEDNIPLTPLEKEQMFVDILPDAPVDDGIAYLSFFIEEKEDGKLFLAEEEMTKEEIIDKVQEELEDLKLFMNIGEGTITLGETEDIDWINNWKQYFHQFYIDDLLVIPSWEQVSAEDQDKMVLHIDPGTAFGTGMHETTALYQTDEEISYTGYGFAGRRNRKRYSGNSRVDVRSEEGSGDGFGSMCCRCSSR